MGWPGIGGAASVARRGVLVAGLCLGVLPESGGAQEAPQIVSEQATLTALDVTLRGLDTLNGTRRDIETGVGETVQFGQLEITVDACRVPASDPEGDAFAFLRIRDVRETELRFAGWMFASSPALSALDHPRYDVWVLNCNTR